MLTLKQLCESFCILVNASLFFYFALPFLEVFSDSMYVTESEVAVLLYLLQ